MSLYAEYYTLASRVSGLGEIDFDALPTVTGTVSKLATRYSEESFWEGGPEDNFAARYTGLLNIKSGGTYTFFLTSDDGSALYINGERVINNDGMHGDIELRVALDLGAGMHDIEIRYFDGGWDASLQLEWVGPDSDGQRQIIEGDAFVQKTVEEDTDSGTSEESTDTNTNGAASHDTGDSTDLGSDNSQISGLAASYFKVSGKISSLSDVDFDTTPTETENVERLATLREKGSFWEGGPRNKFAAHYAGNLNVEIGGTYTFYLTSDDGSALYINGEPVIDNDGLHATREQRVTLELDAGAHDIEIFYFEYRGRASLQLEWAGPDSDGQRQIIEGDAFSHNVAGDDLDTGGNGSDDPGDDTDTGDSGSDDPGDDTDTGGSGSGDAGDDTDTGDNGSDDAGDDTDTGDSGSDDAGDDTGTGGSGSDDAGDDTDTGDSGSDDAGDDTNTGGSGSDSTQMSGLAAHYFVLPHAIAGLSEVDFNSPPNATNIVSRLATRYSEKSFWEGGPEDNFAARYTGYLNVVSAGLYTFFLTSDDGSALYLNGEQVINNDGMHGDVELQVTLELEIGAHDIELLYFDSGWEASLQLEWAGPDSDGQRQIIEGNAFSHNVAGDDTDTGGNGSDDPGDDTDTGGSGSGDAGDDTDTGDSGSGDAGDDTDTGDSGSDDPGDDTDTGDSGSDDPGDDTDTGGNGSDDPGDDTDTGGSGSGDAGDDTDTGDSGSDDPGDDTDTGGSGSDDPGDDTDTGGSGSGVGSGSLSNPSIGVGLTGIADWSSENPFLDVFKSARPWIGHEPERWGGVDYQELLAAGVLDENGWPTEIPSGVDRIGTHIFTAQPTESTSVAGRYRLTYDGEGELAINGVYNIQYGDGEIWFEYDPGATETVSIDIMATAPNGNYIRNITVVHEDNISALEAGEIFNPNFLNIVDDMRSLRFMDWMDTNFSSQSEWSDRPEIDSFTWNGDAGGVPVEVMVELANLTGTDPWFNIPHLATQDYIESFATYVHENLNPNLKAHFEYSNEVWNWGFGQAQWAHQMGQELWPGQQDAWLQYYALKSVEMAEILDRVYGSEASDRLVKVIATQTGWPGLEDAILNARQWLANDPGQDQAPYTYFDAYAVTGYFGGSLGNEKAATVRGWVIESIDRATTEADTLGLSGAERSAYIEAHQYDYAMELVLQELRDGSVTGDPYGSLDELFGEFAYHAEVAETHGMTMVMYEGGQHIVGVGELANDQILSAFFQHLNYSDEMGTLYMELLEGWRDAGGTLFNAFVAVMSSSQWGSWGALRHLDDETSRWDAIVEFNEQNPGWWEVRAEGTFNQSVVSDEAAAAGVEGLATSDQLVANDDIATTQVGQAVLIDVLENDDNPFNVPIELIELGMANNGTVVILDDDTVLYTPDAEFAGTDSFEYRVSDDEGASSQATVTVNVEDWDL